ncbi:MAG: hypothetical protein RLZZ165_1094 [Bacteroidota bacterium]
MVSDNDYDMSSKLRLNLSTLVFFPVLLIPIACIAIYWFANEERILRNSKQLIPEPFQPGAEFKAYWNAGEAEITSYHLSQARYGEFHEGTAVLLFVAEDFSTRTLTKSDGGNGPAMPVLKVNFEKKFITGIYPYSILMTAVSPVDAERYPYPLKVATSSQEWCGHAYSQLNYRAGHYEMTGHSYFPGEGDQESRIDEALPEDAIWTRLRIAPEKLPTGSFSLIPGTIYARLRHQPLTPVRVSAQLLHSDTTGVAVYQVDYLDGSRQLKIWYEEKFPHIIRGWEEDYEEGFGPGARHFVTKASRMVTKKLDYWNHHHNADRVIRTELKL